MIALLLLACGAPPGDSAAPDPLIPLEAPRLLRRLSLDLRGVLPSPDELDAVEADPAQLGPLTDAYLEDPRLEDRLVMLLAEQWHTRVDTFDLEYYDFGLDPSDEYRFERSAGEEPLRLMAYVAAQDLPWTDIVLADYTLADDRLLDIWPLERTGDSGETWRTARWTDGRPAAGVLSSNGLWWRYTSTNSNMNRGRAAAISRLLLCDDFLARPISFNQDGEALDPAEAVHTQSDCLACHAAVDPLASSLFGFWWLSLYSLAEEVEYHPERELMGEQYLGVAPAYFGEPITGLPELGYAIANDSRFYSCAVETIARGLWRRDPAVEEYDALESLRRTFLRQDLHMKALIRAVVETPQYRAGALAETASEDDVARELVARLLSPDQLASAIEDLTGFRWQFGGFDQLDSDSEGYRVLAGGVDGSSVTTPQRLPGLTWELTTERLAWAGAVSAVGRDLALPPGEGRGLLVSVTAADHPGDAAFTEELSGLHWRLYGRRPDASWAPAVEALWTQVEAAEGAESAWAAVVSALLRDPDFLSY